MIPLSFISAPSSSPENVTVVSLSSTSLFISWSPPPPETQNGIISEYRVNITESETESVMSLVTFNTQISVQFLHPFYTYMCVVSAVTIAEGPASEEVVIRTPEDGKCRVMDKYVMYIIYSNQLSFGCNYFTFVLYITTYTLYPQPLLVV